MMRKKQKEGRTERGREEGGRREDKKKESLPCCPTEDTPPSRGQCWKDKIEMLERTLKDNGEKNNIVLIILAFT